MSNQANSTYIAGVCNINTTEVRRRRKAGYFGLFATVLIALASLINEWGTAPTLLLTLLASFISSFGFLQAHYNFCANYALRGKQNVNEKTKIVDTPQSNKLADRKKALKIMVISLALSIVVTTFVVIMNLIF